jgi:hypothetical protein
MNNVEWSLAGAAVGIGLSFFARWIWSLRLHRADPDDDTVWIPPADVPAFP